MTELAREYYEWIQARAALLRHSIPGCQPEFPDDEHIRLVTPSAVAEINFWVFEGEPEIIELRIVNPADPDNILFFLHFQLEDLAHAQQLFDELTSELAQAGASGTTRILLTCTSGLTTGFFAKKLADVAKTLSLDYEFEALPITKALEEAGNYNAVMMAPQVSFRRAEMVAAHPDLVVFEVPGKVFGAYDAGTALRMLLNAMQENALATQMEQKSTRIVRDLDANRTVLVVSIVFGMKARGKAISAVIHYRIYDHGEIAAEGNVKKCHANYQDILDVVAGVRMLGYKPEELDAIGVAASGIVDDGVVSMIRDNVERFDLRSALEERFGVPVFVDNNANAAAVGCYVSQDSYESIALHRQPTGYNVGGQGAVIDGRLVKGAHGLEGELGYLVRYLDKYENSHDRAWTAEGMRDLVTTYLLCQIAATSPQAIYVACDLVPDMEELRAQLETAMPEKLIPDLYYVDDYHERVLVGQYALCLRGLRHLEAKR